MLKVSIITISYNSADTIRQTIESVLRQNYRPLEYLIIDGDSIDETVDIISEYEEKMKLSNIQFKWKSEPDNGISDAFNKGLKFVNGDLIGFIHSNDYLLEDTVELIVKRYIENELPGKAIIYGNLGFINSKRYIIAENEDKIKKLIPYIMPAINHPTCYLTKSIYNEIGLFNERYKIAMDYDLLKRAVCVGNARLIKIDSTLVMMGLNGISVRNKYKGILEGLKISDNIILAVLILVIRKMKRFLIAFKKK